MTNEQRRALAAYVREVADLLSLPHWKLLLHRDYPGEDPTGNEQGYCNPVFGQHSAIIWFRDDLPHELPGRQRYVVVHELLHIHLDGPWEAWADPCRKNGLMAQATYDAIVEGAVRAWEMCIDGIGRSFAPYMPLIDWTATPDPQWIPRDVDVDVLHLDSRQWEAAGHPTPG